MPQTGYTFVDGETVTAAKLNAVGNNLTILPNEITTTQLKSDATIDGNRSVTTDHIRDGAITPAKLSALASQDVNQYAIDSGIVNALIVSLTPTPTAYTTGMMLNVRVNITNTGSSTINVNGLGVKTITKNGSVPLAAGDLPSTSIVTLIYDGTNFQVHSGVSVTGSGAISDIKEIWLRT